ncbi:MAG: hypothetical protein DMF68_16290 [Acidobacteria bacterium]|nr:MAG: hypothetical protein DMF68_16290 [Acidobacteriota bacterium]
MSAQLLAFEQHKLWDKKALADFLDVSVYWIDKQLSKDSGDPIPHIKLGKLVRFDPQDTQFRKWLEGHRVTNGDED